jgi:hypothetical protein
MSYAFRKLARPHVWKRIFVERLSEPLHLNLISLFVAAFGSVRARISFDLYVRQQHAFGLLQAADAAAAAGYKRVTAIEFGVANGAGLLNMCNLAKKITGATGVEFNVVGFDAATGMPPIRDFRDHPELYQPGWYPMSDPDRLRAKLTANAALILGEIAMTVPCFLDALPDDAPIGFVSVDVDYYWSAVDSLKVFDGPPERYLSLVTMYFDDVSSQTHNPWCGELAAIEEFNARHDQRKIAPFNFLREDRILKNAKWIRQMYTLHVLDHPARFTALKNHGSVVLGNSYIGVSDPKG